MIKQIDHIGIAVRNIEEQVKFYTKVMGLDPGDVEIVQEEKVKTVMIPVGEVRLELLEATSDDSPIATFLKKRGEGIHHIAYRVDDLRNHLKHLKNSNVRLIHDVPRKGTKRLMIAFIHPKSTHGVLTELCQKIP